jgi:hypothetical protein
MLSISANITNSENEVVAYIQNNTWKSVSPDSMQIGDRNYNAYAFEIVDMNYVPIFNVRIVGPNDIQIGSVFEGNNSTTLISNNGGELSAVIQPDKKSEKY